MRWQPFCTFSRLRSSSFPSHPSRSESPVGRWWVRGGWKRRNLQAKTNQSNPPLRVLEKHISLPLARSLASLIRERGGGGEGYGEGGIHPTSGKKPTTVDEHFVNGSLSFALFSRLPLFTGADDCFFKPKIINFLDARLWEENQCPHIFFSRMHI